MRGGTMTHIRKNLYFKTISFILVFLMFFQADFLLSVTRGESLDLQSQRASDEFSKRDFDSAIKRLMRLEALYRNLPNHTPEMERKYGQALLLLGACREVMSEPKKNVEETYNLAKNILGDQYKLTDPDISSLEIYRKVFKINTPVDSNKIITKVGDQKKTKKFPWLVVGAVVVAGVVAYFLLAKKPKRTLTVSVSDGVDGTPISGTTNYKNGATVSYNYTLKTGYNALVVKLDGTDVSASGTIKMDKNHTLTATASKTYSLTVTRGVGVDGTPASGTTFHNDGTTVTYSYTLQAGYKDLVVKVDGLEVPASGSIIMNKDHTLEATAGKTFKLKVSKGTGVIGIPETGEYSYQNGETVNYSYSLQSGYENLMVTLDGSQVSASGTITMDREHILIATSGRSYALTVSRGAGVDGSPDTGTTNYRVGDTVNYSYSARTGYKDLVVTLDGAPVAVSGTITMNANHTLIASATALNNFKLTVTRGAGVQGTPESGTANYPEGATVNYSYTLQSGYTDLKVYIDGVRVADSGTITMNKDHILTATSGKTFVLTVTKGEGINGTPETGSTIYNEGASATYSYTLQAGYTDLSVKIDGSTAAASGTITMNANHTIVASAKKILSLTVTTGAGVTGTPAAGTYTKKEGDVVAYSYSLQTGYTNLVVKIDGTTVPPIGSLTMTGNHTISATSSNEYILTVSKGTGVSGTPESGTTIYTIGQTVPYNYSAQAGYTDLIVTLDGNTVSPSGTITMSGNHSLVSTAKKQYTLTVIKGTGVDGSPTATTVYKDGDIVPYNYTLQSGYMSLVVTLDGNPMPTSGTITMTGNHTISATATKQWTLTVTRGTGIDGTPVTGTYTYANGSVVNYSYSLQSGYTDLVVLLDGSSVAAGGSITMNGDHVLVATCGKTYSLTVTRGTGVDGTPVTGATVYTEGQTVSYSYSLQSGYTDLLVTLDGSTVASSGTITMNANHTLSATAKKICNLTVTKGAGISGTPATGSYSKKEGDVVAYNYTLQTGYTDLVVTFDGTPVASIGSVTMTGNHTLIASASREYTLTVSKGTGVDGTPETGTTIYKEGDTVNYSYTVQTGHTNLAVTLDGSPVTASGTITMNANHSLIATASKQWILTVTRNVGVDGTPATGTYTYKNGDSASYSYSLQAGYTDLVVTLDGTSVPASNVIVMTGNHTLVASATKQYTLTVNKGTGVDGTPNSGNTTYKDGDTVTYDYSAASGYTALVVTLDGNPVAASGTFTMSKNRTLAASASKAYTLTVTKGAGVAGTPVTGSTIYADGDSVDYNYSLENGYTDLVVTLDGTPVTASGTVSMTQNHTLTASATASGG